MDSEQTGGKKMEYRVFQDAVYLRLDRGDEVVSAIGQVCRQENITLGTISGLGAVYHIQVGLYQVEQRLYHANVFDRDMEIVSLTGNITTKDGALYLHIHGSFADITGQVVGGHLNEAVISATGEIVIRVDHGQVERRMDDQVGLNVFVLNSENS